MDRVIFLSILILYTQLFALPGWIAIIKSWKKRKSHLAYLVYSFALLIICQLTIYGLIWWFFSQPDDAPGLAYAFAYLFFPWLSLFVIAPLATLLKHLAIKNKVWKS